MWGCAMAGITFKFSFVDCCKILSTALHLAMGRLVLGDETFCHVPTICAIDTEQRVVFTRFEGRIPITDIEQQVAELENDPDLV